MVYIFFQNKQIEIEALKKKNACLRIRLAEALKPTVFPTCDECLKRKNDNLSLQKNLREKLEYVNGVIKVSLLF